MVQAIMEIPPASAAQLLGVDLAGQHVVVVGAGGIGSQVIRLCAALGARLTVIDRELPSMAERLILAPALEHRWLRGDVTAQRVQSDLLSECRDADAAILLSAICPDETMLSLDQDAAWADSFDSVFHVNVAAPMRLGIGFLANMAVRQGGRIVLVGSLAGRMGGLVAGAQYAASKGALHTFVHWLALRGAAQGVNVNGVAPGVTETPMIAGRSFDASRIPAGRAASPLEVARVITMVASPACSYMHGQILDVNGGAWMG